jgi:hypothetical protein
MSKSAIIAASTKGSTRSVGAGGLDDVRALLDRQVGVARMERRGRVRVVVVAGDLELARQRQRGQHAVDGVEDILRGAGPRHGIDVLGGGIDLDAGVRAPQVVRIGEVVVEGGIELHAEQREERGEGRAAEAVDAGGDLGDVLQRGHRVGRPAREDRLDLRGQLVQGRPRDARRGLPRHGRCRRARQVLDRRHQLGQRVDVVAGDAHPLEVRHGDPDVLRQQVEAAMRAEVLAVAVRVVVLDLEAVSVHGAAAVVDPRAVDRVPLEVHVELALGKRLARAGADDRRGKQHPDHGKQIAHV